MKILIVEDNIQNQELAKAQLQGHELVIVDNYTDALKLLTPIYKAGGSKGFDIPSFDVVLTDVHIPLGNTRYFSEDRPLVPNIDTQSQIGQYGLLICIAALRVVTKVAIVSAHGDHHSDEHTAAHEMLDHSLKMNGNNVRSKHKDWGYAFQLLMKK